MSALAEITAAITAVKATPDFYAAPFGLTRRWKVVVGPSAERSILCDVEDRKLPTMIEGCVVERTKDFPGWELVRI